MSRTLRASVARCRAIWRRAGPRVSLRVCSAPRPRAVFRIFALSCARSFVPARCWLGRRHHPISFGWVGGAALL